MALRVRLMFFKCPDGPIPPFVHARAACRPFTDRGTDEAHHRDLAEKRDMDLNDPGMSA